MTMTQPCHQRVTLREQSAAHPYPNPHQER
jgi:hypothetical protein